MQNSLLRKVFFAVSIAIVTVSGVLAQTVDAVQDYKEGHEKWISGDLIGALPLLKKSADAGHAPAQALYGYLLDEADNDVEAVDYYRRAADQGNPDGALGLAGLYLSGDGGLDKDQLAARELLEKAASTGHVPAIISLSHYYVIGAGVSESEKTPELALKWIQKAADNNDIPSLKRLETANREGGLGLPVDLEKADVIQKKIYKIQGIDPNAVKKKRRGRL